MSGLLGVNIKTFGKINLFNHWVLFECWIQYVTDIKNDTDFFPRRCEPALDIRWWVQAQNGERTKCEWRGAGAEQPAEPSLRDAVWCAECAANQHGSPLHRCQDPAGLQGPRHVASQSGHLDNPEQNHRIRKVELKSACSVISYQYYKAILRMFYFNV